jgi:ribosomal protein S18 acetylase RimI-like enzyme
MSKPTPVEIILLKQGDEHVLGGVARDVFDGPVDAALAREFLADRRHHIVVAIEADVVVGMVTAVDYIHPDKKPQLWINEIGVAPTHQRRGIAKRMLEAMLAHGRALGCTEAWVGTENNNIAARTLYENADGSPESFVLYSFDLLNLPPANIDDADYVPTQEEQDLELLLNYFQGRLTTEQAVDVRRRLEEDADFQERVWPTMVMFSVPPRSQRALRPLTEMERECADWVRRWVKREPR